MGWCPGPARRDLKRMCCSLSVSSHEPVDEHKESENEANEIAHVLGAASVDLHKSHKQKMANRDKRARRV